MKLFVRLACSLVIGGALMTSAFAQVRPAIIQDRDQAGRNFYSSTSSCNTVTFNFCQITFPAVPAGKRLIVTHVSALNVMLAANTITSMDLRAVGGVIRGFFNVQVAPGTGSSFNYTTNEATLAKFDAGESAQLITFSNSSASFTLVGIISGYLIDIP